MRNGTLKKLSVLLVVFGLATALSACAVEEPIDEEALPEVEVGEDGDEVPYEYWTCAFSSSQCGAICGTLGHSSSYAFRDPWGCQGSLVCFCAGDGS
jgi:hypothetical protein